MISASYVVNGFGVVDSSKGATKCVIFYKSDRNEFVSCTRTSASGMSEVRWPSIVDVTGKVRDGANEWKPLAVGVVT
jgi:hypothetical protein